MFLGNSHLPLSKPNINTYFSPWAKCKVWGGVGGQFPRHKLIQIFYNYTVLLQSHELSIKPFLVLAHFLLMVNIFASEPRCQEEKITWGSALVNHTFKTVHAENFIGCLLKCDKDAQCRSCNFWWNKLECELNSAARYSAPASFISEVNCVHRDMDYQPGMHNNL